MANGYRTAPLKTEGMPPGVFNIVGNEAAERFSYYGMNAILVPFMTHFMLSRSGALDLMTGPQADAWYHTFVSVLYVLPLVGAFLADAVWGKYRTIFWLSIVYCFGHLALALDHTRFGLVAGLFLIALGAGGIKPCVSSNVGDQFGTSNQHLLTRVFNWFYFSINFGSAFATMLIPWLLEPAPFLAKYHGPEIAFGIPGVLMLIATVIFWAGRKKFVHVPPAGLGSFLRELKEPENLKALASLLMLVPFAAMFWALWQQNFSSWVIQADHLDRHLFGVEWKSAQMQTFNAVFILVMIPLFTYGVYPAVSKAVRLSPLRKFGAGLFVIALAFVVIAWIQTRVDAGQTPSVAWQIPAFVLLTAAEILVSITHLEFSYTQAPKRMKALVMCMYLGSISLGNVFTALVNVAIQNPDGSSRLSGASYFYFFVVVCLAVAVAFVFCARFYRGRTYTQDEGIAEAA